MKILRIVAICPLVEPFYEIFNLLDTDKLTYEEIVKEFCNQKIFFPSSFCSSMRKLGHEAIDVFYDFKKLQEKWAKDHYELVDFTNCFWINQCLETQINFYKPDVLYFERSATGISIDFYENIKKKCPFVKVICGTISWELTDISILKPLKYCDLIFGIDQMIVDQLRSLNINAEILEHSFDNEEIIQSDKIYDLTFLGSSGYGFCDHKGTADHYHRYHDLLKMIKNTSIKLWCYEILLPKKEKYFYNLARLAKLLPDLIIKENSFSNKKIYDFVNFAYELKYKKRQIPWHVNKKPLIDLFPERVKLGVFGSEYFRIISQSKISFNRHVDNINHGGNKRCYEITAMGSCLLCDREKQIKHLFEPDKEAVFYSTIDEAIDKANCLLNNEKLCYEIAKNGQKRTLKDHTYFNRCKTIIKKLQKFL